MYPTIFPGTSCPGNAGGFPSTVMWPREIFRVPTMHFSNVVFPHPLGPRRPYLQHTHIGEDSRWRKWEVRWTESAASGESSCLCTTLKINRWWNEIKTATKSFKRLVQLKGSAEVEEMSFAAFIAIISDRESRFKNAGMRENSNPVTWWRKSFLTMLTFTTTTEVDLQQVAEGLVKGFKVGLYIETWTDPPASLVKWTVAVIENVTTSVQVGFGWRRHTHICPWGTLRLRLLRTFSFP